MINLIKKLRSERAQGLVEMAIITPILVVMLIGVFEVGYAIWGYLTLLNVDREATRFAIRAGALDFTQTTTDDIGYSNVITHSLISNASQLQLQDHLFNAGGKDDPQAAIIISHIVVDTRQPCANPPDCCNNWTPAADYTRDDFVVNPETPGYSHLRYVYPPTSTVTSRLTGAALISKTAELKRTNDSFNCQWAEKTKSIPDWSKNSVIIVEMFYEQPQLLGFPVFSWMLNPMPLYVQTTMRIDAQTAGSCELYPIAVKDTTLNGWLEGGPVIKDILNGGSDASNDIGWLNWPMDPDADYLAEALGNPRIVQNDYTDPTDSTDHVLDAGLDWIASTSGVNNKSQVRAGLDVLIGRPIVIPVWDTFVGSPANPHRYHVKQFASVQITSYDLPGHTINARLINADVTDHCFGNGR